MDWSAILTALVAAVPATITAAAAAYLSWRNSRTDQVHTAKLAAIHRDVQTVALIAAEKLVANAATVARELVLKAAAEAARRDQRDRNAEGTARGGQS